MKINLKFKKNRNKSFTRIVHHPGRIQPFTVWVRGIVVWFAYTRDEAIHKFEDEILRQEEADATKRFIKNNSSAVCI